MPVEVEYKDYRSQGGRMPREAFRAALPQAVAVVERLVGINEVTDEDKYRQAVFAAMEAAAEGTATGSGFTIGSFSMTSRDAGKSTAKAARDAAYEVLATTGMIFGGIA